MEEAAFDEGIKLRSVDAINVTVDAFEYTFPPTKKTLVHGLCAIGFESVSATSDSSYLAYKPVEDFNDGERLWSDREYVGGDGFCEGGTYLQPSKHKSIPTGTKIDIEGSVDPSADVAKICYFVGTSGARRDGGWGQLPGFAYVKEYNWDAGNLLPNRVKASIYCRAFENENKAVKMEEAAIGKMEKTAIVKTKVAGFDEGIKLMVVHGSAEYSSGAVKIISQDSKTVTVELRQAWASTVDKYFYQYNTNVFTSKCFEEESQGPDSLVDTITIQCFVSSPVARLNICLQDTTGDLLDPVNNQGTVSNCCHSDAPPGTPTVCYNLLIDCADNTKRSLRGLSRRIRNDV